MEYFLWHTLKNGKLIGCCAIFGLQTSMLRIMNETSVHCQFKLVSSRLFHLSCLLFVLDKDCGTQIQKPR